MHEKFEKITMVRALKGQFTTDERFDWSDDFNSRDSIVLQNKTPFPLDDMNRSVLKNISDRGGQRRF